MIFVLLSYNRQFLHCVGFDVESESEKSYSHNDVWWSLTGIPQRMNGKVSGRVLVGNSPVPVDFASNDLHSYVVVNDGRAYVAISAIPPIVGVSLQPLSSVGEIIGWAFALQQPGFKNGFSIIGEKCSIRDLSDFTFLTVISNRSYLAQGYYSILKLKINHKNHPKHLHYLKQKNVC